jgi:dUTP pyrophosphatase
MVKVKLKKVHDDAKLPVKSKKGDLCYDVWAVSEEEVAPNVWRYGLGFKYEIVRNQEMLAAGDNINLSIDLRPRSSVWKTGMVLSNCEGTLDEFYRGEAMAVFYHIMPDMPRYKVGERIGQIKLGLTVPMEFEFVDEINENTDRGDGGFGSTGNQ